MNNRPRYHRITVTLRQSALLLCLPLLLLGCMHQRGPRGSSEHVTIRGELLNVPADPTQETRLLDVTIVSPKTEISTPDETENDDESVEAIREAERNFVAYHLKRTLDKSGQWGNVRVAPEVIKYAELSVTATIIDSDGFGITLEVVAKDVTGRVWFEESYLQWADEQDFESQVPGDRDAFQAFYNHVANSLVQARDELSDQNLTRIREVSALRFAAEISPDPFAEYFTVNHLGLVQLHRLPARDAPELQRVLRVKERDAMFGEVLNAHYEDFYDTIWASYNNWRHEVTVERDAKYQARKEGIQKSLLGAVLLGAAIAVAVSDVPNSGSAGAVMGAAGASQISEGVSKLKQIKMHETAMKELTESFATESKPVVVELEGKRYELTGTATEQFNRWQTILHQLYREETAIDTDVQ